MNELQRMLHMAPAGGLADLARHLGVTSSAVSSWKAGKSTPDEVDRLHDIEEYLSLPRGYLVKRLLQPALVEPPPEAEPRWPLPGLGLTVSKVLHPSSAPEQLPQLALVDDLTQLRDDVRRLAGEVEQLRQAVAELQADALKDDAVPSPPTRAEGGDGGARQSS